MGDLRSDPLRLGHGVSLSPVKGTVPLSSPSLKEVPSYGGPIPLLTNLPIFGPTSSSNVLLPGPLLLHNGALLRYHPLNYASGVRSSPPFLFSPPTTERFSSTPSLKVLTPLLCPSHHRSELPRQPFPFYQDVLLICCRECFPFFLPAITSYGRICRKFPPQPRHFNQPPFPLSAPQQPTVFFPLQPLAAGLLSPPPST